MMVTESPFKKLQCTPACNTIRNIVNIIGSDDDSRCLEVIEVNYQ